MADVSVTNTFTTNTTISSSQVNTNYSDLVNFINNRNNGVSSWATVLVTGNSTIGGTLGVTGVTSLAGTVLLGDGLIGTPALSFSSDPDTGLYRGGANSWSLVAGGVATLLSNGSNVFSNLTFVPNADNSFKCGQSGARWTELWATNGTVQTCVSSTKMDILDIPDEKVVVPEAKMYKRLGETHDQIGFIADTLPDECFALNDDGTRSTENVYTSSVIGILCGVVRKMNERVTLLESK